MARSLSWLTTLKAAQLKALATATGLNSSGTKPILVSQLLAHIPHGNVGNHEAANRYPSPQDARESAHDIISIDMGIRNLAYCRLTSPPTASTASSSLYSKPTISDWARIAISQKLQKSNVDAEEPVIKEAFDPQTYAIHAYNLIHTLLGSSDVPPSHILIERQRYRSMGGSAVQEWTLRVNMFEAMLYAVLHTLKERGEWKGMVCPIAPAKVANFWLSEDDGKDVETEEKRSGGKSARTKMAKVELVRKWLRKGDMIELQGRGKDMGEAYLAKKEGRKKGKAGNGNGDVDIGKLDDLADCLLQGMAWVRWEQNRKLILEEGINAMDEIAANEF